jgi:Peptidase of plants and bacteria
MLRIRFELGGLFLSCLGLVACGTEGPDSGDASEPGVISSALTTQESVFGFESATAWTASGVMLTTTSVHSQGSAALSFTPNGYTQLTSVALSALSAPNASLSLDFRPSASLAWGQVQLVVDSPSRGLYSAYVGQASVQGLPADTFSRLDFTLSSQQLQALSGGSTADIRFKIAVNAPSGSGAVVLDNLRFGGEPTEDCATGSAYTLTITGAAGIPADTVEGIRCTFYEVYPDLAAAYNPATQVVVPLTFLEETPGMYPAWVSDGGIFINKGHILRAPLDWDVIVHEGMHIVQDGYSGTVPGWIIEGTADFVRDRYGLTNDINGWSIPTAYVYGQHYLNGYGDAAVFFKWVDANYRSGLPSITQALDDVLRAGTYAEPQTWLSLTGQNLDTLWVGYTGGQAAPATQGVTVYEHSDFGGRAVKLDVGSYYQLDLQARAIPSDWISSVTVPPGYTLKAYPNSDFTGTETVYTSSSSFVGELNDTFSSLIVQ